MALNFPDSPVDGQVFSGPTKSWTYSSAISAWESSTSTVVNPTRTTLTGNGVLSAFAISGADNLTNPSALIVAIDAALQEPVVDYGVSNGIITFTSPLPSGSKAVVISPTNSIQVSNVTCSDGSVTSAKLDNNLAIAGSFTSNSVTSVSANFTGVNRPTSDATGTPASNSLITRDDADYRYKQWWNITNIDPSRMQVYSGSGGAITANYRNFTGFAISTAAGSNAGVFVGAGAFSGVTSYLDFTFNKSRSLSFLTDLNLNIRAGAEFYVLVGTGVLTDVKKTFGVKFTGTNVTAFVCNGSVKTEGNTAAKGSNQRFILDWIAGVGLYVYGCGPSGEPTLISSVTTGLPSGTTAGGESLILAGLYDTGSGGAAQNTTIADIQFYTK